MDELKVKLEGELTRGVISKIVTKILRKKLGLDSLTVMIKQLNGGLKDDEIVARADVVLYASKKELIEKYKDDVES